MRQMEVSREVSKPLKQIPFTPSLHTKTTAQIKHEITALNSISDSFIPSSQNMPVVLLKGVGRFCEAGCGRQIKGRWVISVSKAGKRYSRYMKPKHNEKYCSRKCSNKMNDKRRSHLSKSSLMCELKLNVISDKIPYRELVVYLGGAQTLRVKITSEQKTLWETLERISRYRHIRKIDNQKIEMVASIQ